MLSGTSDANPRDARQHGRDQNRAPRRCVLAIVPPLVALAAQWVLWPWIDPYTWLLFFPAVFLSTRWSGPHYGLISVVLSIILVWYFFIPPQLSWATPSTSALWSAAIFLLLGVLMSRARHRLEIVKDELERKLADHTAALRASEERFRLFLDNSPSIKWVKDEEGRYVYLNRAFEQCFGVQLTDWLGKTDADLWPEDIAAEFHRNDLAVLATNHSIQIVEPTRTSDGNCRNWLITKFPFRDAAAHRYVAGIGLDVTESKATEEALRASEERFRLLFEQSVDGIFVAGPDTRYTDVSPTGCAMLGMTRDEVLALRITDILPPGEHARLAPHVAELADGRIHRSEWRFRRKDGSIFIGEIAARQLPNGNLQAVLRDVTERRAAEEKLRRSQKDLDRAQEVGQMGWWRLDVRQNVLTWSDENHRIFNVAKGTALSYESFLGAIHPDDRQPVDEHWNAALHGAPYDIEHRILANGTVKWVREKAYLEFDDSGLLLGGFGITQDITERKRAEEALHWHARRNELLSSAAALLLESHDLNALVENPCREVLEFLDCHVFFNYLVDETAARLRLNAHAGISPDEASEIEWLDYGEAVCGCVARDGQRILAADVQQSHDRRVDLVKAYGIQAYCCHPLLLQNRVIGTLSFGTRSRTHFSTDDIDVMKSVTDLVAIAMQRISTEHALREADRRKDEFLAMLAHELRNPLAPIRTSLRVLQNSVPDDPAEHHNRTMLAILERQVNHLVRLVDDLLEVSRITQGKIELRKQQVDLAAVIDHAIEISQPCIQAGGHTLTVSLPPFPLILRGDPVRLAQIFANLLNNAAIYMQAGGTIWLSADRSDHQAVVSVRDQGIGIPAEMLTRIFDPFTQVERLVDRTQSGLGVGLNLVRRLADMHGGQVEARSDGPGCGSEFLVSLPLVEGPQEEPVAREVPLPTGKATRRVLVVDDNRDAAASLALFLQLLGIEVKAVYDGPAALEALPAFEPNVVLLDLGMPGMDGYTAARQIRQSCHGRNITLIALTGWSQDEDRRRTTEAGFDHHLVKPVDLDELETLLSAS